MADIFIGVDRGSQTITRDTSSTGLDVEVVIDDAVSLKKAEIVHCLQQIIGYLVAEETDKA